MLSQATRVSFRTFLTLRPQFSKVVPLQRRVLSRAENVDTLKTEEEKMKVVKVEEAGKEAWSGVAQVETKINKAAGSTPILVAGDAAAILLFAIIGRLNHGESILSLETISTAAPFLIGWYTSAFLLDGYGLESKAGQIFPAASRAAKCWAFATPLGLGIRGVSRSYIPPLSFAVVTGVVTFVTLVGWRSAYAAILPTVNIDGAKQENKKGNPLEFLSFLSSIVRRW